MVDGLRKVSRENFEFAKAIEKIAKVFRKAQNSMPQGTSEHGQFFAVGIIVGWLRGQGRLTTKEESMIAFAASQMSVTKFMKLLKDPGEEIWVDVEDA